MGGEILILFRLLVRRNIFVLRIFLILEIPVSFSFFFFSFFLFIFVFIFFSIYLFLAVNFPYPFLLPFLPSLLPPPPLSSPLAGSFSNVLGDGEVNNCHFYSKELIIISQWVAYNTDFQGFFLYFILIKILFLFDFL